MPPKWGNSYWHNETDFEINLVITGQPAVLKNDKVIVRMGKTCSCCKRKPNATLVSSKRITSWYKRALRQLPAQWPFAEPIPEEVHVNAAIVTYAHDKRRRDLDNTFGVAQDALQPTSGWSGILTNDCQIKSLDGSRLRYDKENPRVEITLTPFRETT